MRYALIVASLMIALFIAGAAWTRQPATAADRTALTGGGIDTLPGDGAHKRSSKGNLSRRLLGVCLLAVSGAVAVRARRPLTS
jgi:hypothetical protein